LGKGKLPNTPAVISLIGGTATILTLFKVSLHIVLLIRMISNLYDSVEVINF
jgi:hypothetical protein